jgi:S1-C subfamily serine protease
MSILLNNHQKTYIRKSLEKAAVKVLTSTGFKGTGFFIHSDQKKSFILTAWHCIAESVTLRTDICVQTIDNRTFDAQLNQALSIQELDLAVISIDHLIDYHAVPLAFINKDVIGNEVIAIGYPAGYIEDRGLGVYEGIINQLLDTGADEFETTAIEGCGQSGGMIYHCQSVLLGIQSAPAFR